MKQDKYMVYVSCTTYNHSHYIEETMNGFCMQKTDFPYVCVIIDDASTDGEPEVIKKYLKEHFILNEQTQVYNKETDDYIFTLVRHKTNHNCFFAVYLLKYNHYSKKRSKKMYFDEWERNAKYVAMCEGDDYWIDPLKLQKQVNFLEENLECTMICSRAKLYSESKKRYIGEQYCRKSDGLLSPTDIINRTGLYIPTCSIIYRPWIKDNYPNYCTNCNVCDYPLQITAAMKGSVYYFNDVTCVYRVDNAASWYGRQKFNSINPARLKIVRAQVEMFEGFSKDYPEYADIYNDKIAEHICKNMPLWRCKKDNLIIYESVFSDKIDCFSNRWKLYYVISKLKFPMAKYLYGIFCLSNYQPQQKYYDSLIKRFYDIVMMRRKRIS